MFAQSCTQTENNSFKCKHVCKHIDVFICVYLYEAFQNYSNYKYTHILNVSYSFNQTSNNETSMEPWHPHSEAIASLSLFTTVSRWRAVWEREGGEWQEDTAGEETMRWYDQNRAQTGRRHRNRDWKHLVTFWIRLIVRYRLFSLISQLLLCYCFTCLFFLNVDYNLKWLKLKVGASHMLICYFYQIHKPSSPFFWQTQQLHNAIYYVLRHEHDVNIEVKL